MAFLNRKKLLQREKLDITRVDLEEGEYVFVRQMTARERDNFERSLLTEKKDNKGKTTYDSNLQDFRAKLAVCTVCDENGELIFEKNDYEELSLNIKAAKLEKIVTVASRLNAITEEDKEALVKNSNGDPAADSNSDSAGS